METPNSSLEAHSCTLPRIFGFRVRIGYSVTGPKSSPWFYVRQLLLFDTVVLTRFNTF